MNAIKNWIKSMGFELVNTHDLNGRSVKINYYSLGNFGIYEEISKKGKAADQLRFISWNPWGVDFEVHSVKELCEAYQDNKSFSPELSEN
jgi:hypothetical protein